MDRDVEVPVDLGQREHDDRPVGQDQADGDGERDQERALLLHAREYGGALRESMPRP